MTPARVSYHVRSTIPTATPKKNIYILHASTNCARRKPDRGGRVLPNGRPLYRATTQACQNNTKLQRMDACSSYMVAEYQLPSIVADNEPNQHHRAMMSANIINIMVLFH